MRQKTTNGHHYLGRAKMASLSHLEVNLETEHLADRVALVTGGGRGLGQVFVRESEPAALMA